MPTIAELLKPLVNDQATIDKIIAIFKENDPHRLYMKSERGKAAANRAVAKYNSKKKAELLRLQAIEAALIEKQNEQKK